jgi:hypothetical protein
MNARGQAQARATGVAAIRAHRRFSPAVVDTGLIRVFSLKPSYLPHAECSPGATMFGARRSTIGAEPASPTRERTPFGVLRRRDQRKERMSATHSTKSAVQINRNALGDRLTTDNYVSAGAL